MIGRRAFASKLIKDSNVDVRHKLSKILATASSSPVLSNDHVSGGGGCSPEISPPLPVYAGSSCTGARDSNGHHHHYQHQQNDTTTAGAMNSSASASTFYCDTPINDLVDPVDYEDYLVSNGARINSPLRPLLFPLEDVAVEKYEPPMRTVGGDCSTTTSNSANNGGAADAFNNVQTAEDPYVQSIGAYAPKSLIVVKKYEKCSSTVGLAAERVSRAKELQRQEYEIDLAFNAAASAFSADASAELFDDEDDNCPETPNTFYSRPTSVKNTPRPQSLISSSSTVRPPLASDEDEDFEDEGVVVLKKNEEEEEEEQGCKTPQNVNSTSRPLSAAGIPPIESALNREEMLEGTDSRNSWMYMDGNNANLDQQFNSTFVGSKAARSLFDLQNSVSDQQLAGVLEEGSNHSYSSFFERPPVYYSASNCDFEEESKQKLPPIFSLYPLQFEEEAIEVRPSVPPPSDVPRYRLQVRCLSLKMELAIEPIFASMAIYDARERRKLTENFYFDMNQDSMKRLLRSHISYQDLSTLSRTALFSLSQLTCDSFLVVRLEKVLQGDTNDAVDAYAKPPEPSENNSGKLEKLRAAAVANCERLGRYRMPFAWTAFPLVDILTSVSVNNSASSEVIAETVDSTGVQRNNSSSLDSLKRIANEYCSGSGNPLASFARKGSLERHSTLASAISNFSTSSDRSTGSNSQQNSQDRRFSLNPEEMVAAYRAFKPVTITSKIFYRHEAVDKFTDEDLYKFLADFRRPTGGCGGGNGGGNGQNKRLRCLPGTLRLDISSVAEGCLRAPTVNPELVRLQSSAEGSMETQATSSVSPVKELLEFRDLLIPHLEHRNLLYVYPRSLNFANRQGSARNISIKVQLLASEEKFSALQAIFGKSSCPELAAEAHTAVSYHNRTPSFAEEWKIRLPNRINKQTHLFFTFIHVHTKQKGTSSDKGADKVPGVEEVVGYTWFPLWRDDHLQTGTFSLPVLAEAPSPGYSFLSPLSGDGTSLGPGFKWIDSHRPLFTVHLEAYSSIFAQDAAVDRFFRISASLDSQAHVASYLHSANFVEEFGRAIGGLVGAGTDSLVKFVHLILNRLILLMVRPPQIFANNGNGKSSSNYHHSIKAFQTLVFETVVAVVAKINAALYYGEPGAARTGVLATFIHYQAIFPQPEVRFSSPGAGVDGSYQPHLHHHHHNRFSGLLHGSEGGNSDNQTSFVSRTFYEELLQQWLSVSTGSSSNTNGSLNSPGLETAVREKLYENASFFFDALFKSLCVHLSLNGGFLLPPRKRLSKSFLLGLEELGRTIGDYVFGELKRTTTTMVGNNSGDTASISSATSPTSPTSPSLQTPHLLQNLNTAYAFFLRDLLSVVDRNFVLNGLVKSYIRKLCSVSTPQHSSANGGSSGGSGITTSTASFGYSTVSAEASLTSARAHADGLFELRVDFLRVLAGHEHFVALNLPFGTPLFSALDQTMSEAGTGVGIPHGSYHNSSFSPSSTFAKAMLNSSLFSHSIFDRIRPYAELTDDYRRQHWPLGLVFCTLVDGFTRTKAGLQLRAANLLRALMTSHDWDRRYKDAQLKSRIACLYLPLIGVMVEVISHLHDPNVPLGSSGSKESPFYSPEENRKYRQSKELSKTYLNGGDTHSNSNSFIDNNIAMAIAGSAVMTNGTQSSSEQNSTSSPSGSLPNSPQHSRSRLAYQPISEETTRTLLACFLWVLGNVEQKLLRRLLSEFSNERMLTFLELLRLALRVFEYEGKRALKKGSTVNTAGNGGHLGRQQLRRQSFQKLKELEESIRYGTARRELMRRRDFSQSFGSSDHHQGSNSDSLKLRWRKEATLPRYSTLLSTSSASKAEAEEAEVVLEGTLCTSFSLIIIDSLSLVISIYRERLCSLKGSSGSGVSSSSLLLSSMTYSSSSSSTHSTTTSSFSSLITSSSSTTSNSTSKNNQPATVNLRNKYASDEFVVGSALHLLLSLLAATQSTAVLQAAFNAQRALLHHYPELLFVEGLPEVEFCSEMCYLLLKHCGSRVEAVRAQAAASMYLLMRQHASSPAAFSRIKIQITMSLSQLVGTSRSFSERFIRRSLKSILRYTLMDSSKTSSNSSEFPKAVSELIFNLHMILSDTMQMKRHEQDPEMLLDLMYRVAKGYQNSPELRLTWLQNMAQKHAELSQHLEAAQCYVHAAALVAECLHKTARRPYLPMSCVAFQRLCPNVFEESLNQKSFSPAVEIAVERSAENSAASSAVETNSSSKLGVRSAKLFSETGFVSLLEMAAHYFNTGGSFEAVNEAYKLLIPIHEAHHRWKELAAVHSRLHDVFLRIDQNEGKRVFATYFRVGFYGGLFGELDREEYVYKERFLTKLPEVAHRLEAFYGGRFGHQLVEVIKDSNPVDLGKLSPEKAYIQITYVEPYFDNWELESRLATFERNFNIKRFIYSTPFTFDGRAHGKLYEQCKRKTILTTAQAFPYVKTRVLVQDRHQMVLSPIEVAIEDVQKKTKELAVATTQEPVDAKILQMVLQGCVGTTVNQGPAEIAYVFLAPEANMPPNAQRPPPSHQAKLRHAFKDFSAKCGEALTKNRQLVSGHEQQVEYHKELERNFYKFTERLAPLMGHPNVKQALISLRESYFSGFSTKPSAVSHTNSLDSATASSGGKMMANGGGGYASLGRNK